MSLLFSNEIFSAIKHELCNAESSVQIITAYCKRNTFEKLDDCISNSVKDKRLLVRFRKDDVQKGSTDFDILRCGIERGWKVFVRFDLHAKTYIVDRKRGFVGSANVTNSGLGVGRIGNMEMATLIDIAPEDIDKIDRLFDDAILVTLELIERMQSQIEGANIISGTKDASWDSSITSLFHPHIDTLFSYELPSQSEFIDGEYIEFLDEKYSGDYEKIREIFRWSNAYLWLLTTLGENGGSLFFGSISEKLHNALVTDPKPYRRDVKTMLANLLLIIEKLEMPEVVIDRPNYSQRVTLVETLK